MASSSRKKSLRLPLIGVLVIFAIMGGLVWWGGQSKETIRTITVKKELGGADWVQLDSTLTVVAALQDDGLRYKWEENGKVIFNLGIFLGATLTDGEVDTLRQFFGVMIQWE